MSQAEFDVVRKFMGEAIEKERKSKVQRPKSNNHYDYVPNNSFSLYTCSDPACQESHSRHLHFRLHIENIHQISMLDGWEKLLKGFVCSDKGCKDIGWPPRRAVKA
jgi:hypothetical protein